ncbi:hypothetical protein PGT21_002679 [Puccinia graminis f. sp. tritici]|uniref:Uncharacterized protein n=1 Tax=Puccinia graminis f. sp. tritici TaxID=56615 RepID=A0A5B0PPV1_PUCGR|nr:hypothetical protein PGT21_002679 [Puccinia graminis f. sp. tritici]
MLLIDGIKRCSIISCVVIIMTVLSSVQPSELRKSSLARRHRGREPTQKCEIQFNLHTAYDGTGKHPCPPYNITSSNPVITFADLSQKSQIYPSLVCKNDNGVYSCDASDCRGEGNPRDHFVFTSCRAMKEGGILTGDFKKVYPYTYFVTTTDIQVVDGQDINFSCPKLFNPQRVSCSYCSKLT